MTRKLSIESRKKISQSLVGKKGILSRNYGKHWKLSEETKNKIKKATSGKNSHWWKGGISTYKRKLYLNSRRRAVKKGAIGTHEEGEWETLKAQYNWTCPCCHKKESEIKLTKDHIIPLVKGGSDNIENIQPLCKSCNSRKHTKIIKYG